MPRSFTSNSNEQIDTPPKHEEQMGSKNEQCTWGERKPRNTSWLPTATRSLKKDLLSINLFPSCKCLHVVLWFCFSINYFLFLCASIRRDHSTRNVISQIIRQETPALKKEKERRRIQWNRRSRSWASWTPAPSGRACGWCAGWRSATSGSTAGCLFIIA